MTSFPTYRPRLDAARSGQTANVELGSRVAVELGRENALPGRTRYNAIVARVASAPLASLLAGER